MRYEDAVDILENLKDGDEREPHLSLYWRRTDNFRRKAVIANGNSVILYIADLTVNILHSSEAEKHLAIKEGDYLGRRFFKGFGSTADEAITEVFNKFKDWYMESSSEDVISYFKQRVGLYAQKHGEEIAEHSASIETCNKYGIAMDKLEKMVDTHAE